MFPSFIYEAFHIEGRKNYLYCFDKFNCNKFVVSTRNIASETYFYDTAQDVGQKLEKTLSYLESHFKRVYDKLIKVEDSSCLTASEKRWVATFVATQLIRTREHRVSLKYWIHSIRQAAHRKRVRVEDLWPLTEINSEEGIRSLHVRDFEKVPKLVCSICEKKWILLINQTRIPNWSSDHPVNAPNVVAPLSDFSSPMIQMQIPLSPKVSIWLCNPIMYNSLRSKYEIMDIEKIRFLNSLQVYWSTRYVFSNENDFSLAEQLIRDDPSLRDFHRVRVPII